MMLMIAFFLGIITIPFPRLSETCLFSSSCDIMAFQLCVCVSASVRASPNILIYTCIYIYFVVTYAAMVIACRNGQVMVD